MIWSLLQRAADRWGDRIAVEEGTRHLTYAALAARVVRLSATLGSAGLPRGGRVGILASNSSLYLEAYFAAAHAGLVLVPLNTRARPAGLVRVLAHAEAGVLLSDVPFAALASEVANDLPDVRHFSQGEAAGAENLEEALGGAIPEAAALVEPDFPAQLYYTSGTTGEAKGVILTHGNVNAHAHMAADALALTGADTFGHIAPLFHLADAWATFAITLVGGRHLMVPRFEAGTVLRELADGITLTNLVPTMLGDLVHHDGAFSPEDFPSLRLMLSGGAPISPTLVEQILERFGCTYVQTYGLTETSPFLTMSLLPAHLQARPREEQLRFIVKTGRPLPGIDLRVVKEDGREVAHDDREVGEICVRAKTVTPGYWQNEEATEAAFVDGWFCTGDLATRDAEGFVQIVDRKKDVILSGGESVYSTEVEAVLHAFPGVLAAAAFGLPHEHWGEAVVAAVVCRGQDFDPEALRLFCRERLGSPQVPKRILRVDELPRTGSGKVSKKSLRGIYSDLFEGAV